MIWLNQAATSFPKPEAVYAARDRYFRMGLAGYGRGSGQKDQKTKQLMLQCRGLLSEMFRAKAEHIFFTSGATEALNIVFANTPKDTLVVSTQCRHNAVRRTAAAYGLREILLPPLTPQNYQSLLDQSLKDNALLVLNACSNVTGHCEPIEAACAHVRAYFPSVFVAVDAAQAAGHFPLSMEWGIHYLAVTAHKSLYGPAGSGALITPLDIKPLLYGGTGEHSQDLMQSTQEGMFEAGTRDGSSLGAWAEGLAFVQSVGLEAIARREAELKQLFLAEIAGLPLTVFTGEGPVVSLHSESFSSEEIAALLEDQRVIIRGGMHCAPDMHAFLGTQGTARFSFGWFNSEEDILQGAEALKNVFN